jgi:serine/threonine-protein kinase
MAHTPPPRLSPSPGDLLGRYRLVRQIGRGGMGVVFEARHSVLDRTDAVKVLSPEALRARGVRERFVREGCAASRVDHPHIVRVYDAGEDRGTPYLAMEFLQGLSLKELLDQQGSLPVERAVEVMLPVIAAVRAAHRAGVVHRDLKPANIFLSRAADGSEVVKVLDFGIARFSDLALAQGKMAITLPGADMGTALYMAPETRGEARAASALSDQYSLGVTLQRCVRHLTDSIPPALEAIVRTTQHEDPLQRFATLRELGAALLPFAREYVRARWREEFVDDSEPATLMLCAPAAVPIPPTTVPHALRAPSAATPLARETTIRHTPSVSPSRRVHFILVIAVALGSYLALTRPHASRGLSHAARAPHPIVHEASDAGGIAHVFVPRVEPPEIHRVLSTPSRVSDGGTPERIARRATSTRPAIAQRPAPPTEPASHNGAPILPP